MPVKVLRRVRRGPQRDWMPGEILADENARGARNYRVLVQTGHLKATREPPPQPRQEHTVAELRQVAPTLDRSDLESLLKRERRGKARKTALALLEAALEDS